VDERDAQGSRDLVEMKERKAGPLST
jgi:hypothetical protein